MQVIRKIVEEAFDNWSSGQGSVLNLMGDHGTIVIPGTARHCGVMSKREFVANVAIPFMKRFSTPPVLRPSKIMVDGDGVIVVADAEGTTLDGKPYRNDYVFVLEFARAVS